MATNPGDTVTLVTRLNLFFLSILAFVLVAFSAALYFLAENHLQHQAAERVDAALTSLSNIIERGSEEVEWEPQNRTSSLDSIAEESQLVWLVTDDKGQILDRSSHRQTEHFLREVSPPLVLTEQTAHQTHWNNNAWKAGQRWIRSEILASNDELNSPFHEDAHKNRALSVTVGVSLVPVRTTLTRLVLTLVSLSFLTWVSAFLSGRFVCRRALAPVQRMATAAQQIQADNLTKRLPPLNTHDELGMLNCVFNQLLDRLQVAFERQERFTSEASHQLRTPLTGMLGQLEVILRRDRPAEEYRHVLKKVQQRAIHLASMTEGLLFLARADTEARLPMMEPINLTEWLPRHLQSWSDHSRVGDLRLELSTKEPCRIQAHPALLGELLDILIENASKYSEPGLSITIRLRRDDDMVVLSVEDCGFGIDENTIDSLFAPFNRSEEVRRRGIKGVGLGLAIAKRLVGAFGGKITAGRREVQGACFSLQFDLDLPR